MSNLLKRVRVALGLEEDIQDIPVVELAEAMLIDGETMVRAEEFEVGYTLYFLTNESDLIPALPGEYTLSDGTKLVVDEVGVIQEVIEKEEEVVEEMNEDPKVDTISREEFNQLIEKISKIEEAIQLSVTEFEKQTNEFKEKIQKLSEAPAAEAIKPRLSIPKEEDNALKGLLKKKK